MLPMLITFVIYFAIIFAMGFAGYRATKDRKDYILGGRSLGPVVTAMGVGASDMSGWLMLGLPGAIYAAGFVELWMAIGLFIGAWWNWYYVAPRLRAYSELAQDSLTIPSYIANRFHDKSGLLRGITGILCLVFFTFYSAAGFVSAATLFSTTFSLSYEQALYLSAGMIVFYTVLGGFLAVNWVDLWQGLLMLIALLILPILTWFAISADSAAQSIAPAASTLFAADNIVILSLLAWGLGYLGQPHILVRFMAAKALPELKTARRVCMSWMFLSLVGAMAIGYYGKIYFAKAPLENPETVFLILSTALVNPWITGVMLAAVLSAIMSTLCAQLLVSSSAFAEDFYATQFRSSASNKELLWVARAAVLGVSVVAFIIALKPDSSILQLVSYAWAGLGASFGPVILLSLLWPRMTRNGALCGLIAGGLVVILFDKLGEWYGGWFTLYEMLPGFIAGLAGGVIGSFVGSPPSAVEQQEFALIKEKVRKIA